MNWAAQISLSWRARLLFMLQPISFGSWLPRIPDVQTRFGLDALDLALLLLGMPLGILLTLPFAGGLVGRFGNNRVLLYSYIGLTLVAPLALVAPHLALVFIALMVMGAMISIVELGLNVLAGEVETRQQVVIMQSCHGFWSMGVALGAFIGSVFLQFQVNGALVVAGVAWVSLALAVPMILSLPVFAPAEVAPQRGEGLSWKSRLPGPALLGISFFTFGVTVAEGAMADWSAIYLRDLFHETGFLIGAGYIAFASFMVIGRFSGDWARRYFGSGRLAWMGVVTAMSGVALVGFAPQVWLACVGFALAGLGLSTGFPLSVSAVALLKDRPVAASIAILSFIALMGFLVGPVLVGATIGSLGLRAGMVVLLVPLLASLSLSPLLNPKGR